MYICIYTHNKIVCVIIVIIICSFILSYIENASRLCLDNGTWAERSNYDRCKPLIPEVKLPVQFLEVRMLYVCVCCCCVCSTLFDLVNNFLWKKMTTIITITTSTTTTIIIWYFPLSKSKTHRNTFFE